MSQNPLRALLANQPGNTSNKDVGALKVESDNLRRELMDKKQKITELEQQASKLDELGDLIKHLIQDFQAEGTLHFIDPEDISEPFKTVEEGIDLIRKAANKLIDQHESLADSFELEFQKALFPLRQQKESLEKEVQKAHEKYVLSEDERHHKQSIVQFLAREKAHLMKTVLMRKDALARHIMAHENSNQLLQQELDSATAAYQEAISSSQKHDEEFRTLQKTMQLKILNETQAIENHNAILADHERYQKLLKDEAHAHNCTLAELDRQKDELERLFMSLESYHGNLKTQELLQAEVENKRLRSVLKNEKAEADRKLDREMSRTKDLEKEIARIQENIDKLNVDIRQTEQKLQTQMMKIPDFQQLHQALDRTLAQTQKYKDEVLQRKYVLDEIRDKNRYIEMQEIQESKQRMATLKLLMPMQSELKAAESSLPSLSQDRKRQEQEIETMLVQSGF